MINTCIIFTLPFSIYHSLLEYKPPSFDLVCRIQTTTQATGRGGEEERRKEERRVEMKKGKEVRENRREETKE